MNLSLAHRHYETFDLEWHELGDQSHLFPLMFLADPDGDITARTSSSAGPTSCTLRPVRRRRLEGGCRRVLDGLLRLLRTAGPSAAQNLAVSMGDDLVRELGGDIVRQIH
jgi:hypothetical protein